MSQSFENLKISLRTIIIYTNIEFNLENIFSNIIICNLNSIPLTKKKQNIDKKNIIAPYGAIIGSLNKNKFRGLDLRKQKRKKSNTFFRNQTTLYFSLGDKYLLHVMISKNCIKIAGCKCDKDALIACRILWEDYINKDINMWKIKDEHTYVEFISDTVMQNVNFFLGFPLNLEYLNNLLNDKYRDEILLSYYSNRSHKTVKIKRPLSIPSKKIYHQLLYDLKNFETPIFAVINENKYSKRISKKTVTILVFKSSKIVISGKYLENMKKDYDFFINIAINNREKLLQEIIKPTKTVI